LPGGPYGATTYILRPSLAIIRLNKFHIYKRTCSYFLKYCLSSIGKILEKKNLEQRNLDDDKRQKKSLSVLERMIGTNYNYLLENIKLLISRTNQIQLSFRGVARNLLRECPPTEKNLDRGE
jgi:hypothetical protein